MSELKWVLLIGTIFLLFVYWQSYEHEQEFARIAASGPRFQPYVLVSDNPNELCHPLIGVRNKLCCFKTEVAPGWSCPDF